MGALGIAAIVVACKTPRPAPLAPIATFSTDSTASRVLTSGHTDSVRAAITAQLRAQAPDVFSGGDPDDPLLVVDDARRQVLRAVRLHGVDEGTRMPIGLMGVDPASIERVEAIKRSSMLPPESRGGLIQVTLKPEGALHPEASTDLRMKEEQGALAVRTRALSPSDQQLLADGQGPVVEIRDSGDRIVFSKRMPSAAERAPAGQELRDLPVQRDGIARVEVSKPEGVIRIWLKPGVVLTQAR